MVEEAVVGPSGMDVETEVAELEIDEEEEGGEEGEGGEEDRGKGSFLASIARSLKVSVVGGEPLKRSDIEPALDALKRKLMERNVGHDIVGKIADSVAASLEGKKLGSFTRISKVVYKAVEDALVRVLTPARSIDILREVQANRANPGHRPYVITFVGVNGVGKSTSLAKVAYWLMQHDMKVVIAACDTFRSGAVEQLRTHCQRLGVSLYERGYEKDPAKVAFEGVKQAERERADVVLVDTAGRMQVLSALA
jgi:signal recognition particle receptor subunit alpha